MDLARISRVAGAVLLSAGLVAAATPAIAAPTAVKKITCYKGTTVKVYKAAKCPKGWSPKKPVTPAGSKVVSLNATYKGNLTMVWSASDVKVTELSGTSSDAQAFGLTKLTATGSSSPQAQCAAIMGEGVLSAGSDTVKFKVDSSTKGCASEEAAPSPVSVTGSATITGGTGKYSGATGTLTIKGNFFVKATAAGTKDSQAFTATFAGSIKLK